MGAFGQCFGEECLDARAACIDEVEEDRLAVGMEGDLDEITGAVGMDLYMGGAGLLAGATCGGGQAVGGFADGECLEAAEEDVFDLVGFEAEPLFEDGGVDLSEVELWGQVVFDGHIGAKGGVGADDATLDGCTEEEHGGGGAVVGAVAGVGYDASAKFGEGHAQDALVDAVALEVFEE